VAELNNLQYQVDTLIDAHDALRSWQSVVNRALICGPDRVAEVGRCREHGQCAIGKLDQWLAENSQTLPQHRLGLQKLNHLHQQVTDMACKILHQRLADGKVDCDDYTAFEQSYQKLDQAIWQLQSELHFLLFSRDSLTGLPTRRELVSLLPTAIQSAREAGLVVYLAIMDIDHFKPINDKHGHHIGDQALRLVSDRLRGALRRDDALFRYGGEEFVLLLTNIADEQAALKIVERARLALCEHPLEFGDTRIELSASFGLARLEQLHKLNTALAVADAALYRAKAQGRNRVVVASAEDYQQAEQGLTGEP